jgi:hypothetical protein
MGSLFSRYFEDHQLSVNPIFCFTETQPFLKTAQRHQKLLKLKSKIDEMIGNGIISKKNCRSEMGSGSYDEYSDQAIGKTMQD